MIHSFGENDAMTGHLELWVLGAARGRGRPGDALQPPGRYLTASFSSSGGLALGLVPIVPEIGLPPDLRPL